MSYRKLEVWQVSREIVIEIHKMSLQLPKFELFEEGQQIRRSSKSVKSTIVEGYGRRRYKNELSSSLFMHKRQMMKQLIILKHCLKQAPSTMSKHLSHLKKKLIC